MKKLIITCLFPLTLFGQVEEWSQTFGDIEEDDFGYSVEQTSDGGYIVVGSTYSSGNGDVYLVKTDGSGQEVWSQTFGGELDDNGHSIQQTNDGGFIIVGYTNMDDGDGGDVYLIKTDGNGQEVWSQTFGGMLTDVGESVQQTNDGGYIITGRTRSFGEYGDVYLIKTDGNGQEVWSQTFGGEEDDGYSVKQTSDGGVIITGRKKSSMGDYDVYLIKTDGNGQELWNQTFGGEEDDLGHSIQQTNDGGYIIVGYSNSYGGGEFSVYLIKTNESGQEQWSQTFGGVEDNFGYSVEQTNDEGYVITGYTRSYGNGNYDVYLIKTDENGQEQWSQTFGGTQNDFGRSVKQTNDGGYIITGLTPTYDHYDLYLIKTTGNGGVISITETSPKNSDRKLQKTVDILGRETKHHTNLPLIDLYDDGSVEKRIIVD